MYAQLPRRLCLVLGFLETVRSTVYHIARLSPVPGVYKSLTVDVYGVYRRVYMTTEKTQILPVRLPTATIRAIEARADAEGETRGGWLRRYLEREFSAASDASRRSKGVD